MNEQKITYGPPKSYFGVFGDMAVAILRWVQAGRWRVAEKTEAQRFSR